MTATNSPPGGSAASGGPAVPGDGPGGMAAPEGAAGAVAAGTAGNCRRWLALVVVCLGMFMNALDASIVNVALPAIQRQLHFTQSGLTWVVDAFLITFGSLLLLAGRLGDLIGRKKVFLSGIAVFTAASVMCGIASDQAILIVGRFLQGAGGAMSGSVIIAIIVTEFPLARERARAMSAYIFVAVGGGSIGLLVGGVLTQTVNWHWIFFINVPIGIATFVMGRILVQENVGIGIRGGVDIAGSLLITICLVLGIFAIVTVPTYGWGSLHTLGFGAASICCLVAFLVLESKLANPIMPLSILRIPTLARSSMVRGFLNTGMFATFFLGALYFEKVLGYSPIVTGLSFLPLSLTLGALSTGITANLVTRFGNKRVLIPGIVSVVVGLLLLSRAGIHPRYLTQLFPAFFLLGLGAGLSFMPLLAMAMSDVPNEDAGLGSGIVNVSMQVAAAVGLAVLGTVATNRTADRLAAGVPPRAALTAGYQLSFVIAAGCAAVGLLVAVVALHDGGTAGADPEERRRMVAEVANEPLAT